MTAEERRLEEARSRTAHWRRWGPYLSERQWGTVREDYSSYGTAWDYFPHDHARSRAYRWGEDGIAGISDNHQRLCFAIAIWNGGAKSAVNSEQIGTKVSGYYLLNINVGQTEVIRLRLSNIENLSDPFGSTFNTVLQTRKSEADEFYDRIAPNPFSEDARNVQRQAFAGMLWNKQFYHFVIADWLKGDPNQPPPQRQFARNSEWFHLFNDDILSMPDKWEFPWFAAWDLAFHTIPLAMIDPDFAKRQLDRLTREWYMHPNGQIPAYEWKFSDVNPPVEAWATWRVYEIEKQFYGSADTDFLERVFQKLLLNFTWWVNRQTEFLSPHGIRSVSKFYEAQPYVFFTDGQEFRLQYEPAESRNGTFGGNSNWRGPVWVQMNYLLIESLQKFHHYMGDEFRIECPTGSGQLMTLAEVATELSHRFANIFLRNKSGDRAVFGGNARFQNDPYWRDLVLFHEYFNGDNGAGLGANHQTGWTGLVATLISTLSQKQT